MSRRAPILLLFLCLIFGSISPLKAQTVTRADSAAVLMNAARAFEAEGKVQVAEALLHFISERYGDTQAGAEARASLQVASPEGADRSSQVELMVWSTTYGLWLGVAIPGALGANDPGPYGAGLLIGGPVGFLGGRALARSRPMSEGQVRAITFGSLWGTWQGWGLLELMDWGQKEYCDFDVCWSDGADGEDVLKAMVVGGLAGLATGAVLARKPISSGVATTTNFGALWGTWFGFAGGVLANLEDDQLLGSTMAVGNAGLLATAFMAPEWNFSRNRARLISIAGVIGLLGGFGVDLMVQPDNEKVAMGIPLVGSIAGLTLGWKMTSDSPTPTVFGSGTGSNSDLGPALGGSLLSFQDGNLRLGTPSPFPTLLPVDGPRGLSYRPGLGFNLFSSRF